VATLISEFKAFYGAIKRIVARNPQLVGLLIIVLIVGSFCSLSIRSSQLQLSVERRFCHENREQISKAYSDVDNLLSGAYSLNYSAVEIDEIRRLQRRVGRQYRLCKSIDAY